MSLEIERKFLVRNDDWRREADGGTTILQGYICTSDGRAVRVRQAGERGTICIKISPDETRAGVSVREEYQYEIPPEDCRSLLQSACRGRIIRKVRYRVPRGDLAWEIDVFAGDNAGLVIAEVELDAADREIELPDWVGKEVTSDPRYLNVNLAVRPYRDW